FQLAQRKLHVDQCLLEVQDTTSNSTLSLHDALPIFSSACGMAKAAKLTGADYRVYAVLGDGEIQEGQVWEAAMFASHYNLDNLRSEEHTSELQSRFDIVCSLLLGKKKTRITNLENYK